MIRFKSSVERIKLHVTSNPLLVYLAIYVLVILLFPLLLRIPFVKPLAQWCLAPLGDLKSSYISFSGTSIGSFLAIFGAFWVQDKNRKKQSEMETKKSALIVYFDLQMAIDDLYPVMIDWLNAKKTLEDPATSEKITKEAIIAILSKYRGIPLYLDSNWINNVANIRNKDNMNLIGTIYRTYEYISNFNKVLTGQITDENVICESIDYLWNIYYTTIKLEYDSNWEISVHPEITEMLDKIKVMADINDDIHFPKHHRGHFKIRDLKDMPSDSD